MGINENVYIGTSYKVTNPQLNSQLLWVAKYCTGTKSGHVKMVVEMLYDAEKGKTSYILHFTAKDNVNRTASVYLDVSIDPFLFFSIKKLVDGWDSNSFNVYLEWSSVQTSYRNRPSDAYTFIIYNVRGREDDGLGSKRYNRLLNRDIFSLEAVQNKINANDIVDAESMIHAIITISKILLGTNDHGRFVMFREKIHKVIKEFINDYHIPVTYPEPKEDENAKKSSK